MIHKICGLSSNLITGWVSTVEVYVIKFLFEWTSQTFWDFISFGAERNLIKLFGRAEETNRNPLNKDMLDENCFLTFRGSSTFRINLSLELSSSVQMNELWQSSCFKVSLSPPSSERSQKHSSQSSGQLKLQNKWTVAELLTLFLRINYPSRFW